MTLRFPPSDLGSSMSFRQKMKKYTAAVLLAIGIMVLPVSDSFAEDWPQWRGPGRDAKSSETNLFTKWDADGPPLLKKIEGIGEGYAGVAVVGDVVYTTGNKEGAQVVSAIDASGGKILWQTPVTGNVPQHGYEGSRSTPSIDGN